MTRRLAATAKSLLSFEGGHASVEHIVSGADQVCERMMRHLARWVGLGGARALVDRSFHLTRSTYPWLVADKNANELGAWLGHRGAMGKQSPETAVEAFGVWFANLVGLLERFIGDALVARLLHEVAPEVFPRAVKEST